MTYNNGRTQTWEYDVASNLVKRKTAAAAPAEQFQNFTYDERNRKKSMSWSDPGVADRASFAYDAAGRMTEADNDYSEVTRTYDPAGRLKTDTQNIVGFSSRKVQYKYSQDALLLRMWVADGNGYDRSYSYDNRGRLEFIKNTSDGANWFQYSYDQASNEVKRFNFWNGVSQEYGRDEMNRMSRRDVKLGATTISSEVYRYDEMSRLRIVDREDGKRDRFDPDVYSGQLDIARYGLVNDANATTNVDYNWDKAGNRVSVIDTGSTTNYARNLVNQYSSVGNNTVTMGGNHEIKIYGGNTYTYLGDGQVSNIDSTVNHYAVVYDALGRPVKRTLTGSGSIDQTPTYYVYDGDKPILEYKANGNLAGLDVYGNGIDEILMRRDYVVVPAGQRYFYQQNHQGSVTHLTDSTGAVIEKYSYDAFGKTTTTTMATGASYNNRFNFTGREHLPAFSVYEYRARLYHPGLGRFMSEDPKGFDAGDYNLFRYCGNDPVDKTDPMGLAANDGTSDLFVPHPTAFTSTLLEGPGTPGAPVGVMVTGQTEPPWKRSASGGPPMTDYGSAPRGDQKDSNSPSSFRLEGVSGTAIDKVYTLQIMSKNGPVKGAIWVRESFGKPFVMEGNVVISPDHARTSRDRFVQAADGKIKDHVAAGPILERGSKASGTAAWSQHYAVWSGGRLYYPKTPLTQMFKYQDGVPVGAHLEVGR